MTNDYSIQALQRGIKVLDTLLELGKPSSLDAIARHAGLPKSTVFRLLINLIQGGLAVETPTGYWLGLKFLRFSAAITEQFDLLTQARPVLQELRGQTKETVHLGTLVDDFRVFYLEKLPTPHVVGVMISGVGRTVPGYCTGLGKAMMANAEEESIRQWLATSERRGFTSTTLTKDHELLEEFARIREQGYAFDRSEHEDGIRCVAAPIRDASGRVIAAISVASPANRMPNPLEDSPVVPIVIEKAHRISEAMGCARSHLQKGTPVAGFSHSSTVVPRNAPEEGDRPAEPISSAHL